jgi:hypothetical protein
MSECSTSLPYLQSRGIPMLAGAVGARPGSEPIGAVL